jgi:L-ribulose-5-phosphate 4-epimerase
MAMAEQELRGLIAQCCRMLEANNLIDFSGHVSSRSAGGFLINPRDQSRFSAKPEELVEASLDGSSSDKGRGALPSEAYIHSSIYHLRSDVNAIAHLHSPAVITLSIAGRPIFPAVISGAVFADGIPIYHDSRLVNSIARGDQLAKALGNARAVILRGHGSVVVAESIKSLFFACIYFERNAERLREAYQIGNPQPLPPEELEEMRQWLSKERVHDKIWDYYTSMIEHPNQVTENLPSSIVTSCL